MNDDCRKRLGEFLGEYWYYLCRDVNRTFTTERDMMTLYRKLWETGKWEDFWCAKHLAVPFNTIGSSTGKFSAWLFCLSGEGYEEACKRVDDFLEGKG